MISTDFHKTDPDTLRMQILQLIFPWKEAGEQDVILG